MIAAEIQKIDQQNMKKDVPVFAVGDTVKVFVKIREGDKERIQAYSGIVIARDGRGSTQTFTVRRVSYGVGVERVFPLHSPRVDRVVVEGTGHSRRAKLYYLRDRTGKQSKLKEKVKSPGGAPGASVKKG